MATQTYWINRANQRMDDYILSAESTADEITKAYYKAARQVQKDMVKTMQSLGEQSNITTALKHLTFPPNKSALASVRAAVLNMPNGPERDEALTMLSSPAYLFRIRRLQATIDNARKQCECLYRIELQDATEHLQGLYSAAFNRTMYDIDRGYNTLHTFSQFPASRVTKLLKSKWSGANYSARIWNSTSNLAAVLKEQLLIAFMTGASVSEVSREIRNIMQSSAANARRLVRTETNYIANRAEMDAYRRLGISEYKFIATLDTRTSTICQALDGRVFNIDDEKAGVNSPPMHPNCRSTTIMYDADHQIQERAARDENGKRIRVPGNMTYKEWIEKYHPELMEKREQKKKTENEFKPFTAQTVQEAENYANEIGLARRISYGNADLDRVNVINNTLARLTKQYPINQMEQLKFNGRLRRARMRASYFGIEFTNDLGENMLREEIERIAELHRQRLEDLKTSNLKDWQKAELKKKSKATLKKCEESLKYNRFDVGNGDVEKTITHEYGHVIADQYFGQFNGRRANSHALQYNVLEQKNYVRETYMKAKRSGDIYNISEYASTNEAEFFAETFVMYDQGEKLPDYVHSMIEKVLKDGIL